MANRLKGIRPCSRRDIFTYFLRLVKLPISRRRFTVVSPPFLGICSIYDSQERRVFSLKTNSVLDYWTISQVFFDQDYSLEGLTRYGEIRRLYDLLTRQGRSLILDLGANIGASAKYLSLNWPAAEIWCVEPSARNVDLLRRNARSGDRFFHSAIGNSDGYCIIANPIANPDGFRVTKEVGLISAADKIELISMMSMMKQISASGNRPFILKIDIEGAESDLFEWAPIWLNEWPVVMVEIHDWMLPGSASSANVLKALAECGRDVVIRGSTLVSISNRLPIS